MSPETVLYIILTMLGHDNATPSNLEASRPHLEAVATAISKGATKRVPATRLIALAYRESRFGYREAIKGKYPKTSAGACGIFQQIPSTANAGKTTCKKLGTDLDEAVKQAVAYTKYIKARWKAKSESALDRDFCHYFSGNDCDDNRDGRVDAKDDAYLYGQDHRKARLKAIRLARRGKKVALKGKRHTKRLVASKGSSHVHAGGLSCAEWKYALHHERDEGRRAELGLPPNTL